MILKKIIKLIIFLLLIASTLILSILLYVKYLYPYADYTQFANTIKDLTFKVLLKNTYPIDFFWGLLFFFIATPVFYFKFNLKKQLIATLTITLINFWLSGYITFKYYNMSTSTLYEEEYINPNTENFTFPEKKRNLILVFLESFENDLQNEKYYQENLIPNLSSLQTTTNHSTNFQSVFGTGYSIASLVAVNCGIPLQNIENNSIEELKHFLPQATCFPEILQQNGYQTKIIKAADIKYTRADVFSLSHGYNKALGIDELNDKYEETKQSQYKGAFGGLNDNTLFEYSKKELAEFDENSPFLLTLFTLNTHGPDYYIEETCNPKYNNILDSFTCTDKIVGNFVKWFNQSQYKDNTTLVIIGDHPNAQRLEAKSKPQHKIYNVFLNTFENKQLKNHSYFTTMDLAPTILDSIGVHNKTHSFGLGRSLFIGEKTLYETMKSKFSNKLIQQSAIYNKFTTIKQKRKKQYHNYTLNTELKDDDFLKYTNMSISLFNSNYLDNLGFLLDEDPTNNLTIDFEFRALIDKNETVKISVNKQLATSFKGNNKGTYKISFDINKDIIKNKKLYLKIDRKYFNDSPAKIGVSPVKLVIREKQN